MTEAEAGQLLEETDDFELCDRVFCAAADLTDNQVDFDSEPEPLRTVSMVWLASGVIGNGGFGYLLEYKCGNDREMRLIADAFRRVGATACSHAFQRLFDLFPQQTIIEDYHRKFAHYLSLNEKLRNEIDIQFYAEDVRIPSLLANFIREYRDGIIRGLTRHI
jgi:hypothetical protein